MVNVTCPHCGREFEEEIEDYDESTQYETEEKANKRFFEFQKEYGMKVI